MFLTICSGKHLWSSYGISAGNNSAINLPHTGLTVPSVTFLKQPQNADKLVFMDGVNMSVHSVHAYVCCLNLLRYQPLIKVRQLLIHLICWAFVITQWCSIASYFMVKSTDKGLILKHYSIFFNLVNCMPLFP